MPCCHHDVFLSSLFCWPRMSRVFVIYINPTYISGYCHVDHLAAGTPLHATVILCVIFLRSIFNGFLSSYIIISFLMRTSSLSFTQLIIDAHYSQSHQRYENDLTGNVRNQYHAGFLVQWTTSYPPFWTKNEDCALKENVHTCVLSWCKNALAHVQDGWRCETALEAKA